MKKFHFISGDRIDHSFVPTIGKQIFFFGIFAALFLIPKLEGQSKVKATGTGQTTGHIANLTITNSNSSPLRINPQIAYIPSGGQYQPYIAFVREASIPPYGTSIIPVDGYCADVTKPPVGSGTDMPPISTWVPVGNPTETIPEGTVNIIPMTPKPPFEPGDIPGIMNTPGFKPTKPTKPEGDIITTWPGTDKPVGGVIEPDHFPEVFAPVIVDILERIKNAADVVLVDDEYDTPISSDPEKERESVIQQTFWIVMADITGDEYNRDHFTERVYNQFQSSTGKPLTTLPEEQKEKVDDGIAEFWNVFTAVGTEAKVISNPEPNTVPPEEGGPPPPEEISSGCRLTEEVKDTGPKLDYAIADTGTKGKNEKVKEAFKKSIEEVGGIISNAEGSDTVDVGFTGPEMPASCWSLYFPHVVAGQANASAFVVDMKNPTESAWTTQPLNTKSNGERTVVLTHHFDANCKSTLIGINYAKVRASSGLKASLGNIEALKVVNFVGEVAIEIVLKKGKGTYTKLSKYLKEKTKEMAKDEAKEFIKDQLKKLGKELEGKSDEEAEKSMDELLKEIKSGEEEAEDAGDFLDDWLAEQLIEGDDFDPMEKIEGDILDKIDSPIDWSPIKTNTYAIGEGSLDVYVDGDHGIAKAASGVRYKRVELESKEEAEKGGGIVCDEGLASNTTSGQITLKTIGNTASWAAATGEGIISTGHGIAVASLESFNGMFVIAICECPDGTLYDFYTSITAYSAEETMTGIWVSVFESLMHDVVEGLDTAIGGGKLPKDYAAKMQKDMESAAARAGESILPCEK